MNKQLENLLVAKNNCEESMNRYSLGFGLHNDLCTEIKAKLESGKLTDLEKARLKTELSKNTWEARIFATNFKAAKNMYDNHFIPEAQKLGSKADVDKLQFINTEETAKKISNEEIFGKCVKEPENVEHPMIINDLKDQIMILEQFILAAQKKVAKEKDAYEIAKLNLELFESGLHLQTLNKRLSKRLEYYYDVFLPVYEVEFKEAKEKLDAYWSRACEFVNAGINSIQFKLITDKYEEHRSDDEKLWLYYTTLKKCVNETIDQIKKDKCLKKIKGIELLTNPI